MLLFLMRKRIEHIEGRKLLSSVLRISLAAGVMSAAAYGTHNLLQTSRYLDVLISILVALVTFGACCKLLRVEELGELLGVIRFGSKPPPGV
jgi:hypothetical protein